MYKIKLPRHRMIAAALFFLSLTLYLILRSNYLDDWDSVGFALGLDEFNMFSQQPHPPGYPSYIFLGKIFNIYFRDAQYTLTFMSSLCGAFGVLFVFLLANTKYNLTIGFLSALIFSMIPAYVTSSAVAMSDVVALSFALASTYFIVQPRRAVTLFGFLLLGFTLGIRPQNAFILGLIYFYYFLKCSNKRLWFINSFAVCAGILIWLIPTIYIHDGLINYFRLSHGQFEAFSQARFNFGEGRLAKSLSLIQFGWELQSFFLLLIIFISFILEGVKWVRIKYHSSLIHGLPSELSIFYWLIWFLIAVITTLSWYVNYISRYILLSLPAVAIIGAWAINNIYSSLSSSFLKITFSSLIVVGLITTGINGVRGALILNQIPPAPVQAAKYISDNYPIDNTIIIKNWDTGRHFDYYLKGFEKVYPCEDINLTDDIKWLLSTDDLPFYDANHEAIKTILFQRPSEAYQKHQKVILHSYNLEKAKLIVLGTHEKENWGFWLDESGGIFINSDRNKKIDLNVSLQSFEHQRELTFSLNGDSNFVKVPSNKIKKFEVPFNLRKGYNLIEMKAIDGCDRPCDFGGSSDSRCLSIGFSEISIDAQK